MQNMVENQAVAENMGHGATEMAETSLIPCGDGVSSSGAETGAAAEAVIPVVPSHMGTQPGDKPPNVTFEWHKDAPPGPQSHELSRVLASLDTMFRTPDRKIVELRYGSDPRWIRDTTDLEAVIRENITITVFNKGKISGNAIPAADLKVLLRSSVLQTELPVVDKITANVTFTTEWEMTRPGYNDGPDGQRYFYTGKDIQPERDPIRTMQFLNAMPFKSQGDRANALAFALTTILRHQWAGGKPMAQVTANKSHAGKDTVLDFAVGKGERVEIAYHYHDWALQNEAVSALSDPNVEVLVIGNIRTGGALIESAFLERTITTPKSLMQSSKRRGDGYRRDGDFVIAATANNGRFSIDLANRGLPIHLDLVGDVHNRPTPIGDPRADFLPAHRDEIEAELCGLIENWKDAGRPLDDQVRHPMNAWAQTIGGILKSNRIEGFLSNWNLQRSANDATREALGELAMAASTRSLPDRGDGWLRVETLRKLAEEEGIISTLMDRRHQESTRAVERQLGVALSAHRDETLFVENDEGIHEFTLRKARRRVGDTEATVYKFEVGPVRRPEATSQTTSETPAA
jgi:hypothetical protein